MSYGQKIRKIEEDLKWIRNWLSKNGQIYKGCNSNIGPGVKELYQESEKELQRKLEKLRSKSNSK